MTHPTDPSAPPAAPAPLSRRERQILDIVYRRGRVTAQEIRAELADAPSDSSVRTLLRLMEEKGHLAHEVDGPRFVYFATVEPEVASRRAVHHVIRTFFGGSAQRLVSALLDDDELVDDAALAALAALVEEKRRDPT